MKKLMVAAAAALTATIGFGVESSNVVGYQTKANASAQMNWTCNTFVPCDKTKTTMTLGDMKGTDGLIFSAVVFLKPDGRVKTVEHAQLGTVKEKYTYWEAGDTEDGVGGWYFEDDENAEYNQNSRIVALGEGYYVQGTASEIGEGLLFSGAVANDSTPLEVTSSQMNWFGNCSPTSITLGDITATDGLIFSAIVFLKDDGRVKTVEHAQLGTVKEKYTYWEAGDTEDGAGGWYFEDDENAEYNQNARVIAAGEGFYVQGTASEIGESISVPSAL